VRRVSALLLVLAVATAVAAGAATAGEGDPNKRIVPADQRLARSIVLRASDLGSGWKAEPRRTSDDGDFRCSGYEPDLSDLTITGEAESRLFWRPDGLLAGSGVEVYATAAQAATGWRRSYRPRMVLRCLSPAAEKAVVQGMRQAGSEARVKVVSARRLPF